MHAFATWNRRSGRRRVLWRGGRGGRARTRPGCAGGRQRGCAGHCCSDWRHPGRCGDGARSRSCAARVGLGHLRGRQGPGAGQDEPGRSRLQRIHLPALPEPAQARRQLHGQLWPDQAISTSARTCSCRRSCCTSRAGSSIPTSATCSTPGHRTPARDRARRSSSQATSSYRFNDAFSLAGGIGGLPSTRTTNYTFPNWLKVDHRTIADEFFRGSYTTGVWAGASSRAGLKYRVMLGNNLSQLGVDAGKLDAA